MSTQPTELASVTELFPAPPVDLVKDTLPTPVPERERIRFARSRQAVRIARLAATDPRTKKVAALGVRHGGYLVGGTRAVTRRAWEGRTAAGHQRLIAAAVAAGDFEAVADWQDRADKFRQQRHARRMQLLTSPQDAARSFLYGTAGTAGALLLLGICLAIANGDVHDVVAPVMLVIDIIKWLCFAAAVVWGVAKVAGLPLILAGLWDVGRRRGTAPAWALPAGGDKRDVVPDEGAILNALRNLGIAPLNKVIKEGWQPRWVSPTTRLGNGWHTQLQLPLGVTVEMIADKKQVLGHNLMRKPIEVWPTEPREQPGVLDLWVADSGVLTKPVPAWPLLTEGTADFFKGVPVALNARGEQVIGRLMAANYLIAGIMGSGKSSLVVALLLGAMLDPLVEIDVHVLAYNSDYDAMRPRLRSLVKGDDDEHVVAAMDTLRALAGEVSRRGQELERLGTDTKVTREMAERDPSMRPRIVVFDEVHELFSHKVYGEEAKELALKVTKKARKTAIMMLWITPDADAASLPRGIAKTVSHRVAFAINDHQGNDSILGTGMHKNGYSATTLVAGEDVGTAMAAGFGKSPGLIRSYYVRKDAKTDEVTPVVARAVAMREGVTLAPAIPAGEPVDHLADVLAVLGDEDRVRTPEVLHRLKNRNASQYGGWDGGRLKAFLDPLGAGPYKSNGNPVIARDRVAAALAERNDDDSE
jgi:S-DNA-T family DNA segregation ATPase FtsK/SpoIIIE